MLPNSKQSLDVREKIKFKKKIEDFFQKNQNITKKIPFILLLFTFCQNFKQDPTKDNIYYKLYL